MSKVLAADIGGTNIRMAVVASGGSFVEEQHAHFGSRDVSGEQLVSRLTSAFAKLLKTHPDIRGIGAGFPGFFHGESGMLIASPNLPRLKNIPLAQLLSEQLHLPVVVQNDALCAALGEATFGAAKDADNLLHITLGTGIGGGLIINRLPYSGENGMAMEFGHLHVEHGRNARQCGCGGSGCVEAYASASTITARYAEVTGETLECQTIFERAMNGDNHAREILESAGSHLGCAIAQAVILLDIHTVTVSGGLTGAWSLLYPALMTSLDKNLIPPQQGRVRVLASTLNDTAGLLGAATLPLGKK